MTPDIQIIEGDCIAVLRAMPDNSVDAVICDPPYDLTDRSSSRGFNGATWDATGIAFDPETWREALRVLKPGAYLQAFGGTRTWHRMATAIEDAGFEIKDGMAWLFGSGFPKSRNVTDAMQRYLNGDGPTARFINPDIYRVTGFLREAREKAGWTNRRIDALFGTNGMAGHWTTNRRQPAVPSMRQWAILKEQLGFGDELDDLVESTTATEHSPEPLYDDRKFLSGLKKDEPYEKASGYGTTLKPAFEPIVVARKPVVGTVTKNVATYGTGAINVEAGRNEAGRWPANVVLDEYAATVIDGQSDTSPSRHFYVAKPTAAERPKIDGVGHATVKPLALMRQLVRLFTPPGGTVLDPFLGSGTTAEAALLEGVNCVGVEQDARHAALARLRLMSRETRSAKAQNCETIAQTLFADDGLAA